MKNILIILVVAVFSASMTSCGTSTVVQENQKEIAGYTLKNKKQLLEQKILNKKQKTVIAQP